MVGIEQFFSLVMRTTFGSLSQAVRNLNTKPQYRGPAFAFDIDGVLLRGRKVIPTAPHALKQLLYPNMQAWRVPVAFLTNGGGSTEAARARLLSDLLQVPVYESQVVLAHTPMRDLTKLYSGTTIVTVGGSTCAEVARTYGFQNVIDTETLAATNPKATPFARLDHVNFDRTDSQVAATKIGAVFVMADSRDWGRDIQLLLDILQSDGSPSRRPCREQTVDLYFSNPDILFPNEHIHPRLAGGTFRIALEAVFEHVTTRKLKSIQFGKPHAPNYRLAEQVLQRELEKLGFHHILPPIYAIGDNPKSDVRGANRRGDPWRSILVRTGNFQGDNDHTDAAKHVHDDVLEAVSHALQIHSSSS